MKSFDLRSAFIEKPAQGQQVLGGHNSANNCVPDSLLECYQALTGKWPCNPQDLTAAVYGQNYIGGETFSDILTKMRQRTDLFPALPATEVHDFGSKMSVDLIGEYGAQGFPMATSFYCDTNGKILTYWSSILHASCPVASDGTTVWIWNVEGYEVKFSLADFVRAYQGALVIFKRSVHTSNTATAGSEVRIQEEDMALISGDGKDPRGRAGAIYATNGVIKRYIGSPTEVADLLKAFNQTDVVKVGQWTVDRMPEVEGAPVASPGGEVLQFSALKATDTSGLVGQLDAIKAGIDKLQGLLPGV